VSDPLRACVLLDGETIPSWQASALRRLLADEPVEVTLAVVNADTSQRSLRETVRRGIELREWGAIGAMLAARRRLRGPLPSQERIPIGDVDALRTAPRRRCEPISVDGWKQRLPEDVVDEIAASADVVVRFGFGVLVGRALTATEHGVLSYHHGDLREYRGMPMGFWEYVHGRDTAGVTLQRLNETLDGGEIVASERVDIDDADRWGDVKTRLFEASEPMLARGVRNLRNESWEPTTPDELGDLYTTPKGKPVLTYLARTARGTASIKAIGKRRGDSES